MNRRKWGIFLGDENEFTELFIQHNWVLFHEYFMDIFQFFSIFAKKLFRFFNSVENHLFLYSS